MKRLVKRAIEEAGAHRISRLANRRKALILMYHGIAPRPGCPDWGQLPVAELERQLEYVQEHYRIVPLGELVRMLDKRRVEPYSAAITFDDGYRSVHDLAYPVLLRRQIPATVYLTTGFVCEARRNVRYIWTDYVSILLDASGLREISLDEFGLGVHRLDQAGSLQRARSHLTNRLKLVDSRERERVLRTLEERFASRIDPGRYPLYEPMTWDEAARLAASGLVTLGAHTRSHPILSRVDSMRREDEILGSKRDIESRLEIDIQDFAFPNGRPIDFDADSLRIVRGAFRSAVTTVQKLNPPGQDPHRLHRIGVGSDLTLARFTALASGLYGLMA